MSAERIPDRHPRPFTVSPGRELEEGLLRFELGFVLELRQFIYRFARLFVEVATQQGALLLEVASDNQGLIHVDRFLERSPLVVEDLLQLSGRQIMTGCQLEGGTDEGFVALVESFLELRLVASVDALEFVLPDDLNSLITVAPYDACRPRFSVNLLRLCALHFDSREERLFSLLQIDYEFLDSQLESEYSRRRSLQSVQDETGILAAVGLARKHELLFWLLRSFALRLGFAGVLGGGLLCGGTC